MDKKKQHQLTQTVNALRCAATGIAAAIEQEEITAQQVHDLLITIANQQTEIIQRK